ncbi:hypothetical protein BDF19DRAFT_440803, partial [Syncephalis fuscata]
MISNSYFSLKTVTAICMVALLAFPYDAVASPIIRNTNTANLQQTQDPKLAAMMNQLANTPVTRNSARPINRNQQTTASAQMQQSQDAQLAAMRLQLANTSVTRKSTRPINGNQQNTVPFRLHENEDARLALMRNQLANTAVTRNSARSARV